MIMEMERKLNPTAFFRRFNKTDKFCVLSTAQYWDWLTYIDDDYLTEWEIIKMKELYYWQLQELSGQAFVQGGVAVALSYLLSGPLIRSAHIGWHIRLPFFLTFFTFLQIQSSNWERPCKSFHDVMCQPAPHGTYLRRTLKEHFPIWWEKTSYQLHQNGYSLPEMNEYDKSVEMPRTTKFNSQLL